MKSILLTALFAVLAVAAYKGLIFVLTIIDEGNKCGVFEQAANHLCH